MPESVPHCRYIRERAQKITEALYRVTDLFPEQEPLKWLLRQNAIEIFKHISSIENQSLHERTRSLEKITSAITQTLSALELAAVGTFISRLNFEVLQREYLALKDFIQNKKEDFLPGLALLPSDSIGQKSIGQTSKGHKTYNGQKNNKETLAIASNRIHTTDTSSNADIKTNQNDVNTAINQTAINQNRQKQILDFIRDKDWVSIGEIYAHFQKKGFSEKTMQRELAKMVNAGILKKQGEKRWRRYAIV